MKFKLTFTLMALLLAALTHTGLAQSQERFCAANRGVFRARTSLGNCV